MANIGLTGLLLILGMLGMDPGSAIMAHGFGSLNFGLMMMIGGGL